MHKQRSEEWIRERRDQLKAEVCRMFEAAAMSMADMVKFVDTLERLGIDNHFVKEIDGALYRVHNEQLDFGNSNDLHVVALRFRLLRQHGFWVPAGKQLYSKKCRHPYIFEKVFINKQTSHSFWMRIYFYRLGVIETVMEF